MLRTLRSLQLIWLLQDLTRLRVNKELSTSHGKVLRFPAVKHSFLAIFTFLRRAVKRSWLSTTKVCVNNRRNFMVLFAVRFESLVHFFTNRSHDLSFHSGQRNTTFFACFHLILWVELKLFSRLSLRWLLKRGLRVLSVAAVRYLACPSYRMLVLLESINPGSCKVSYRRRLFLVFHQFFLLCFWALINNSSRFASSVFTFRALKLR